MKKLFTASLLILVGFTLVGCSMKKPNNTTEQKKDVQETNTKVSIADILNSNSSKECTYTMNIDNTETKGIMYINGKKMYNTATLKVEQTEQQLNYLMLEDWVYTWGSALPGMKINIKAMEDINKDKDTNTPKENLEYDKLGLKNDMNLDCKNWNVDNSKFELPKNIEFKDITQTLTNFSKQYKQTTEKVEDLKNDMCGACNMTPDENTKKECLASLGCK